jgi:hypothetical protein
MKVEQALALAENFIKEQWPDVIISIPLMTSIATIFVLEEISSCLKTYSALKRSKCKESSPIRKNGDSFPGEAA